MPPRHPSSSLSPPPDDRLRRYPFVGTPPSPASSPPPLAPAIVDEDARAPQISHNPSPFMSQQRYNFILFLLRLFATAVVLSSLKFRLHYSFGGNENSCTMTWSGPAYEKIDDIHESVLGFRLHRYSDRRLTAHEQKSGDGGCLNPIIFIPGQGGEYAQSRSLGSTVIGMWRKTIARRDRQTSATVGSVYAVDWGIWKSATVLQGEILKSQANYVVACVIALRRKCGADTKVAMVGHSIGGVVARRALSVLAEQKGKGGSSIVSIIVTLGCPHADPPISWEKTVVKFWDDVHKAEETAEIMGSSFSDVPIVSISGGFRDELIDPQSTNVDHLRSGISVPDLSPLLGKAVDSGVPGVDHRALVWCQNVLAILREMFTLLKQPRDDDNEENRYETNEMIMLKEGITRILLYRIYGPDRQPSDPRTWPSFEEAYRWMEARVKHSLGPIRHILLQISTLSFFAEKFSLYFILASLIREMLVSRSSTFSTSYHDNLNINSFIIFILSLLSSLLCVKEWNFLPTVFIASFATSVQSLLADAVLPSTARALRRFAAAMPCQTIGGNVIGIFLSMLIACIIALLRQQIVSPTALVFFCYAIAVFTSFIFALTCCHGCNDDSNRHKVAASLLWMPFVLLGPIVYAISPLASSATVKGYVDVVTLQVFGRAVALTAIPTMRLWGIGNNHNVDEFLSSPPAWDNRMFFPISPETVSSPVSLKISTPSGSSLCQLATLLYFWITLSIVPGRTYRLMYMLNGFVVLQWMGKVKKVKGRRTMDGRQ